MIFKFQYVLESIKTGLLSGCMILISNGGGWFNSGIPNSLYLVPSTGSSQSVFKVHDGKSVKGPSEP